MFCSKCGVQNDDGLNFCANCGAPLNAAPAAPTAPIVPQQPVYQQAPAAPVVPGKGLGVAGMVLSIVGLVFGIIGLLLACFWFVGFPCSIIGLILSAVASNKAKKAGIKNSMATAGIVCSCILLGLYVLLFALAIAGMTSIMAGMNSIY